jgi:hypothetical protein
VPRATWHRSPWLHLPALPTAPTARALSGPPFQISGLESLTKLENLSLFNNRIESLDGLEPCVNSLQVLSIGNNRLSDLEQTKTLRKFPKLHAVTFAGNPMGAKEDYRPFVLAHLRHLRFLDYRLVDESEVAQAESDGTLQEKLQEIRLIEQQQEEERESERKTHERSALLASAHMQSLNGFWAKMDQATAEFTGKVHLVEQLAELHAKQRTKFESRLEDFVQSNLTALAVKSQEHKEYLEAAAAMKAENNAEALAHIARYAASPRAPSCTAALSHHASSRPQPALRPTAGRRPAFPSHARPPPSALTRFVICSARAWLLRAGLRPRPRR